MQTIMRPVAVFDLDGTFYREQFLFLLMVVFLRRGIFPKRLRKPFRDLIRLKDNRDIGYHDYDHRLIALFLEGIEGADVKQVEAASRYVAKEYKKYVYTFTRELVEYLRATHDLITITGANEQVVQHVVDNWKFKDFYGTKLEIKDGKFTGRESELSVTRKGEVLLKHIADHDGLTLEGSVAIGDSRSDAEMLKLVSHPIAFSPDDLLAPIAEENGWPIVVERRNLYVNHGNDPARRFPLSDAKAAVAYVLGLPQRRSP